MPTRCSAVGSSCRCSRRARDAGAWVVAPAGQEIVEQQGADEQHQDIQRKRQEHELIAERLDAFPAQ